MGLRSHWLFFWDEGAHLTFFLLPRQFPWTLHHSEAIWKVYNTEDMWKASLNVLEHHTSLKELAPRGVATMHLYIGLKSSFHILPLSGNLLLTWSVWLVIPTIRSFLDLYLKILHLINTLNTLRNADQLFAFGFRCIQILRTQHQCEMCDRKLVKSLKRPVLLFAVPATSSSHLNFRVSWPSWKMNKKYQLLWRWTHC